MTEIGVLASFEKELREILKEMKIKKEIKILEQKIWIGNLFGKDAFAATCGTGKTCCAMMTQKLIDEFKPKILILTGLCGSLNPELKIGDIVFGLEILQHDVDITALGYEIGEIPLDGESVRVFKPDSDIITKLMEYRKEKIFFGRILTGDQFISDFEIKKKLREKLQGDAVDMEAGSFALVCTMNKIRWAVIKIVSDLADQKANIDFRKFRWEAAQKINEVIKYLLSKI